MPDLATCPTEFETRLAQILETALKYRPVGSPETEMGPNAAH